MSEWKEYKFLDLLIDESISYGIVQPGFHQHDGVPVIRVNNIKNGKILTDDILKVSKEIETKFNRTRLVGGELLITVVGSVGECAIVPNSLNGWNVARAVSVARIKTDFDTRFIKYSFQADEIKHQLYGNTNDTVQPTLNLSSLKEIVFPVPPLPEQTAIAEVLSSLDDKIDLLHRQNNTLEQMAETLFRQWFVEEAEEGWENETLGNIFDIKIGRTPPRKEAQWFTENPKDVKWISIRDLGNSGVYITEVSEYLTKEAVEKFNIPTIAENTVVLSFKLTVGRVAITTEKMLSNEAIAHFNQRSNSKFYPEFLYLFLKSFNYESLGSTSSIAEAVNSQMIKGIELQVPDEVKLLDFKNIIQPLFQKIKSNTSLIQTLTRLRDSLLPRLMSGEVRVVI